MRKLFGCSNFKPNLYIIFLLFWSSLFACMHSVLLTTLLILHCLYYFNIILNLICEFLRFLHLSSLRILTVNYFFFFFVFSPERLWQLPKKRYSIYILFIFSGIVYVILEFFFLFLCLVEFWIGVFFIEYLYFFIYLLVYLFKVFF